MKKAFALALLAILLLSAPASATYSRIWGMDLETWMVDDEAIISEFPGRLINYPNMVEVDYWGGGNGAAMANIKAGPGVLSIMPEDYWWGGSTVMYGLSLDKIGLTAGLNYSSNSNYWVQGKTDLPSNVGKDYDSSNWSSIMLRLGAMLNIGVPLDLAVDIFRYSSVSDEYKYYNNTTGNLTDDYFSGTPNQFEFELRALAQLGAFKAYATADIDLPNSKIEYKEYNALGTLITHTLDSSSGSNLGFQLGTVYKTTAAEWLDLYAGARVRFYMNSSSGKNENKLLSTVTSSSKYDYSGFYLPLYAGAEIKLGSSWKLRGGLYQTVYGFYSQESENKNSAGTVTGNYTYSSSYTGSPNMSIGASWTVGDFTIDSYLDWDVLLDGPQFISGNGSDINSEIGVRYSWK